MMEPQVESGDPEWDVFISHAHEDKPIARELADQLAIKGLTVWLDELRMDLGASLLGEIDRGLLRSRFGVVILSPDFFKKVWTKSELDGLVAKEMGGGKVVLPVWHNLTSEEVRLRSPILAGRLSARTNEGIPEVVRKIVNVVRKAGPTYRPGAPIFAGRLTKKVLSSLPPHAFLMSNLLNADHSPKIAEKIPDDRSLYWERLKRSEVAGTKVYVFQDAGEFHRFMERRDIWDPIKEPPF